MSDSKFVAVVLMFLLSLLSGLFVLNYVLYG